MVAAPVSTPPSWEASASVSGLDFGAQLLQRFYSVEKLTTGSSAPHILIYKPVVCGPAFESCRPLLSLATSIIKWKYIIFLFNDPEVKIRAAAMWPRKTRLKDLRRCLLTSLHDCHMRRVKIQKTGMTIYLYAVKATSEEFVMEEMWSRLQQLAEEKGSIL